MQTLLPEPAVDAPNVNHPAAAHCVSPVDVNNIDRVFHLSPLGAIATDAATQIVYVNLAFEHVTGYAPHEALGCTPSLLHSGRHGKEFYRAMWQSLRLQGWWQGEVWNRNKNGDIYPEWLTINRICNKRNSHVLYLGLFSDISRRKEQESVCNYEATHDVLTGLANQVQLQRHLYAALERARVQQRSVAVLYIDLDRFKLVNDHCGHERGNQLLKSVAGRLQAAVRQVDFIARVGGDEFVVVLDGLRASEHVATEVARKILATLSAPLYVDSLVADIGCSIGISIFPDHGDSVGELLKTADIALYKAKRHGGGCLFQFDC